MVPPTEPCALRSTQPLKVSARDFSSGKGGRCILLTGTFLLQHPVHHILSTAHFTHNQPVHQVLLIYYQPCSDDTWPVPVVVCRRVAQLQVGANKISAAVTTATSEAGFLATIRQVYNYRRYNLSCFPVTKDSMQLSLLNNLQNVASHVKDTVSKVREFRCSESRPFVTTNFNTVV